MSGVSAELVIRFQNKHLCFFRGMLKEAISGTLQTLEDIDLFSMESIHNFNFVVMWDYYL